MKQGVVSQDDRYTIAELRITSKEKMGDGITQCTQKVKRRIVGAARP